MAAAWLVERDKNGRKAINYVTVHPILAPARRRAEAWECSVTNADSGFQRRNKALQERISGLCRAILRISASLDRDIVLREIVDSARTLTGAHGAVLTTIGETGQPKHFLSSGTTPDEHRRMEEWNEGPRLFAHLGKHRGPFRIGDWTGPLESLGLNAGAMPPLKSVLGTPIRHQGVHVGTATEYDVLRVLSTSAGHVSTYRSLVRRAWSRHDGAVDPSACTRSSRACAENWAREGPRRDTS